MDVRHSQLVLIEKKIETANDKINDILQKLGWTREELITWHNDRKRLQTCPFNKRHVVPEQAMKEHYRSCLLKSRGAKTVKKGKESESSLFFYKQSPSVVSFVVNNRLGEHKNIIDTTLLQHQQQQTQHYYVKELEPIQSITEKCQAYDQVIQRSNQLQNDHHQHHRIANLKEIDSLVLEKQKRKKSQLHNEREQLNKRRRKQYRVKVKMNTATEIQKELINAYMQEYSKQQK
ncbi:unnamed protein product [Mucor hiemalis]